VSLDIALVMQGMMLACTVARLMGDALARRRSRRASRDRLAPDHIRRTPRGRLARKRIRRGHPTRDILCRDTLCRDTPCHNNPTSSTCGNPTGRTCRNPKGHDCRNAPRRDIPCHNNPTSSTCHNPTGRTCRNPAGRTCHKHPTDHTCHSHICHQRGNCRIPATGWLRSVLAWHRTACPEVTQVHRHGCGAPAPARRASSPACRGHRRISRPGRHRRS